MSTIITNRQGDIIRRSRNLRGILDHARRSHVIAVECENLTFNGLYSVTVHFADGTFGQAAFASPIVLRHWIKARRSWGLELVKGSDTELPMLFTLG